MKNYELNCLISLNASLEEVQGKIEKYLKEQEANSISLKNSGKRSLPKFIKTKDHPKTDLVNFLAFNFKLLPEKIKNLENKIKSEKEILRYLILEKKIKTSSIRRSARKEERTKDLKQEKVKLENINEKLDEILDDI